MLEYFGFFFITYISSIHPILMLYQVPAIPFIHSRFLHRSMRMIIIIFFLLHALFFIPSIQENQNTTNTNNNNNRMKEEDDLYIKNILII